MKTEQWALLEIDVPGVTKTPRYAISNYGRIKSFQGSEAGTIIRGSTIQGYRSLNIRLQNGISHNKYIHKVVAENFISRPSNDYKFVIHLDYDKLNNQADNLKWVTKQMMVEHNRYNPNVLNKVMPKNSKQYKLTENKVRLIKKMLKADTTRLKMIAKQFGITHTQLNRIRSGANWGYVTID